jgi:uncharacterized protein (DUF1330 family)
MVIVLGFVTIAEDAPEALAAYLEATGPLLQRVGARIVKRFAISEVVAGKSAAPHHAPSRTVIMVEYPNREAVDLVFGSAEYAAIRPIRDRAFLDYTITVVDDLSEGAASQQSTA